MTLTTDFCRYHSIFILVGKVIGGNDKSLHTWLEFAGISKQLQNNWIFWLLCNKHHIGYYICYSLCIGILLPINNVIWMQSAVALSVGIYACVCENPYINPLPFLVMLKYLKKIHATLLHCCNTCLLYTSRCV